MEIKMENSIMMLMLSLKISASVWNHRSPSDTYGPSHMFLYRSEQCCVQGHSWDAVEMRCCVNVAF